jgi:magnesium-transporting ATPase (P-type)
LSIEGYLKEDERVECLNAERQLEDEEAETLPCTIQTATYLMSSFCYMFVCIAFNIGKPFRSSAWTNYLLVISMAATLIIDVILVYKPEVWGMDGPFILLELPQAGKVAITIYVLVYFVVVFSIERAILYVFDSSRNTVQQK